MFRLAYGSTDDGFSFGKPLGKVSVGAVGNRNKRVALTIKYSSPQDNIQQEPQKWATEKKNVNVW